jgi:type I restriction enzyme, S subunit
MTNGWQTVQLGEVLTQDTNYVTELEPKTYPKLSVKLYGKGAVLDAPTDGSNVKMQRHQFAKPGQIILSEIWAKKGAIGIVPKEGEGALVTSHFFLFDIDEKKVLRDWIGLLLKRNYFAESLDAQARGTTGYAAVRPKQFLALEIPLPPLTEQRRIVAHIESLAARVHEAQRLREETDYEADVFIGSSLNKLVRDLEQNHKISFLEELLIDANYGTSVKCFSERTSGTIPVLRIPNVVSEKVTLADLKYGDLNETELKKTVLSDGDILVVRTNGSRDLVGRCAVVHQLPEPMAFASYMIRIRCNKEVVLPEYLQLALRQQRTGGHLIDFARTTAGQYNVSLGRLKNAKIPIPPLDEQRRIVAYLDGLQTKVNALRELQAESEKELSALMPSILDKAFKGEL